MEAIGDLIGAIAVAIAQVCLLMLQGIAAVLGILLECLVIAFFSGLKAALERFRERSREVKATLADPNMTEKSDIKSSTGLEAIRVGPGFRLALFIAGPIFLQGVLITSVFLITAGQVRANRIAATQEKINQVARGYAQRLKDERSHGSSREVLDDKDAWNRPLELFVDRFVIGSLVVVRSSGPDCRLKTLDDQLAIVWHGKKIKQLGQRFRDELIGKLLE